MDENEVFDVYVNLQQIRREMEIIEVMIRDLTTRLIYMMDKYHDRKDSTAAEIECSSLGFLPVTDDQRPE